MEKPRIRLSVVAWAVGCGVFATLITSCDAYQSNEKTLAAAREQERRIQESEHPRQPDVSCVGLLVGLNDAYPDNPGGNARFVREKKAAGVCR